MNARFILFAAIVATASAVAAVGAPTASAISDTTSGHPGSVSTGATLGYYDMTWANLDSRSITANRSPATSGTQIVAIRWRVWRLVGSTWMKDGEFTSRYTVYPNQYVSDPGWTKSGMSGVYSTDITITWRTPTGTLLGGVFSDYIHSTDYQCYSWQGCSVFWNGDQYALALT